MTESCCVVLRLFIIVHGISSEQCEDTGWRCSSVASMGDASKMVAPNAYRNVDTKSYSHEFSYRNKNS